MRKWTISIFSYHYVYTQHRCVVLFEEFETHVLFQCFHLNFLEGHSDNTIALSYVLIQQYRLANVLNKDSVHLN